MTTNLHDCHQPNPIESCVSPTMTGQSMHIFTMMCMFTFSSAMYSTKSIFYIMSSKKKYGNKIATFTLARLLDDVVLGVYRSYHASDIICTAICLL